MNPSQATEAALQLRDVALTAFVLLIAGLWLAAAGYGFVWIVKRLLDVLLAATERGLRIWYEHAAKLDEMELRRSDQIVRRPAVPGEPR
jgi:hypothetical protein